MDHDLITRSEAKASGQSHYFTGKPCHKGHIALRRVKNQSCVDCNREARNRRYGESPALRETAKNRAKEWAEKNPDAYKANQRKWRENNPGKMNQYVKNWETRNPDTAKASRTERNIVRHARVRAAGKLSVKDIRAVRSRGVCAACGIVHPKMEVDHIVSVAHGGTNHLSNLQLLCGPCNRSKSSKDHDLWLAEKTIRGQQQ